MPKKIRVMTEGWVNRSAFCPNCGNKDDSSGKLSMQEGMMDGDGWVPQGYDIAPTDGNGISTREHWDGCPSVFDLWGNIPTIGALVYGVQENRILPYGQQK